MLLRNYFNWKYYFQNKNQNIFGTVGGNPYGTNPGSDPATLGLTCISSSEDSEHYNIGLYRSYTDDHYAAQTAQNFIFDRQRGACIGSGTAEASVEDYALASEFGSSVTCTISSETYENTEDFKIKKLYVITGKNNGSDTVTISEVGIWKKFYTQPMSSYDAALGNRRYLMLRQLLATPIEVEAGKDYQITLEVDEDLSLA